MQVANLAKALRARGWKVTVVSMLPEGSGLAADLRLHGVSVVTLGMQKGKADPESHLAAVANDSQPQARCAPFTYG